MEDHHEGIATRLALVEQHVANLEACMQRRTKELREMKDRQDDMRFEIRLNAWKLGVIIGVIVLVGTKLIDVALAWGAGSVK